MKGLLPAIVLGLVICGCSPKPAADAANANASGPVPPGAPTSNRTPATGSGGVSPIGPAVGGMTPMAGTDSVAGAGGGGSVGQAAKDMAKRTAAQSSAPGTAGGEDGSGQ